MALQGNLVDLPLIDILQLFSIQNKTGLLNLSNTPYTANIYQVNGFNQLVYQTGLDAVYELLSWDEGEFSFAIRDITNIKQNVSTPTPSLILGFTRRKDEFEERKRYSQMTSLCPKLVADLPYQNSVNLELYQWHILMQMNGQNSVAQIAQKTGQELSVVVQIIQDFKNQGLCDFSQLPRENIERAYTGTTIQESWKIEVSRSTTFTTQPSAGRSPNTPMLDKPSQQVLSFPAPRPPELAFATIRAVPVEKPKALRSVLSGIMSRIRGL